MVPSSSEGNSRNRPRRLRTTRTTHTRHRLREVRPHWAIRNWEDLVRLGREEMSKAPSTSLSTQGYEDYHRESLFWACRQVLLVRIGVTATSLGLVFCSVCGQGGANSIELRARARDEKVRLVVLLFADRSRHGVVRGVLAHGDGGFPSDRAFERAASSLRPRARAMSSCAFLLRAHVLLCVESICRTSGLVCARVRSLFM